jgi:hypothetical protein
MFGGALGSKSKVEKPVIYGKNDRQSITLVIAAVTN